MKTRTLIIPDVHTRFQTAEGIIKAESPDKTVFLGDYFDSFGEESKDTKDTARWLKESLSKPDRTHLVGNHDIPYITSNTEYRCSGFSEAKKFIIDAYKIPWEKLAAHCFVGGYLCTHAGLSRQFFEECGCQTIPECMEQADRDLKEINDLEFSRFFQAGASRGGRHKNGGVVWCDYGEFVDIPQVRQIFGHTRGPKVRQEGGHICLDTALGNYIIHQDDTVTIKETGY